MINLYARLGILPTATVDEIQQAIKREERKLSIEDLKKCQEWLLNPEKRAQYTTRLYGEHPEVLTGLMAKIAEQAAEKAIEKYRLSEDEEDDIPVRRGNRHRNSRSRRSSSQEWFVGVNNKKLVVLACAVLGALSIFLTWYSVPIVGNIVGTKIEAAWYSFGAFAVIALTMLLSKSSPFDSRTKVGASVLSVICVASNLFVRHAMMGKIDETASKAGKFAQMATDLVSTNFGFYLNIGMGIGILLVVFLMQDD